MQNLGVHPARILISCLLVSLSVGLSTIPQFQVTNKYIETGTAVLNTSPYYGNISANSQVSIYFTTTFSRTISSYDAITSLKSLRFEISSNNKINVTTYLCGYYTNGVDICVLSTCLSQISVLSSRYLVLDSAFTKITHFYSAARFYVQYAGNNTYNSSMPIISNFGLPGGLITSGTVRALVMLNGFNATASTSTNSFDIKLTATYLSATTFQVRTQSSIGTPLYFSSIIYCIIGYNENVAQQWPFPAGRITLGTFTPFTPFTDSNSIFQSYNTFWGVTKLSIHNQNFLEFDSSVTATTSITGSTPNVGGNFEWQGMVFEFKECNSTTPYYMISEDRCYDICPDRYYQSSAQMTCENCTAFDCLKCLANGTCTSCDNTTDHRQLNPSTGRCQPMDGYYQSNVAVALPCDGSCKTCSASGASACTSCNTGDYLSGGSCVQCMANCSSCVNGTYCSNCTGGLISDGNGNCVFGYNCSNIDNCQVCDNTNGCSLCNTGYNLANASYCSNVCGDGIWVSEQQCDGNNSVDGDGCSSTCMIQPAHYCVNVNMSTSTCGACSSACLNCTSATNCTNCQSLYVLTNTTNGEECLADCSSITLCSECHYSNATLLCDNCSLGYSVRNNSCEPLCGDNLVIGSEECDDGNTVSGDGCSYNCTIQDNYACPIVLNSSHCTLCNAGTYQAANKTACSPCTNYDCETCLSSGNCTSCDGGSNRFLNPNTSRCEPNDGFYDDGSNKLALPCSHQCSTCSGNSSSDCLACPNGRVINGTSCPSCAQAIGPGCSNCAASGVTFVCTACVGSTLTGSSCVFSKPQEPSGPSLLMILLPVLAALLCCCCCIILFCIWRRRKNEENKVVEETPENNGDPINQQENLPDDPFDEKLLTNNLSKKKYRGGEPKNAKIKKRRAQVMQETEQNELSMEQFKETMISMPNKKKQKEGASKEPKVQPIAFVQAEKPEQLPLEQAETEIRSEKHEVNDGPEDLADLPPEPQKEEVHVSEDRSERDEFSEFKSQDSDDFNSAKGR